ncbi:CRTAC1 family protein [Streptomyces sp. CG4]|uniref:CRTAC1 family protein n=1 Tax=unclassified Streptomyces TaxID=2593676 RepID=UPI00331FC545
MNSPGRFLRAHAAKATALCCCLTAFSLALPDAVSAADRAAAAAPFHFTAEPLNAPDRPGERRVRPVAPAFHHIRSWISSVGAGAGLFAADGGTVAHDVCLVDPRTDTVTVEPAPGTGKRYRPFTLAAKGLYMPSYAAPMGCMPADLNQDGRQDLVVYYWGRSPVLFLRKPGATPARAAFVPRELVPGHPVWNTNAMTLGDFEGNGHLDLVVGNYFKDGARVLDPTARQSELQMPSSMSHALNGGTLRYFRFTGGRSGPQPEARFAEVRTAFGPKPPYGWTLALGAQDLDGDGLPDLYQANDFGRGRLLINESRPGAPKFRLATGTRHFTTPKSKQLGNGSFKGMGVAFADLDRSGTQSILVGNITEPYALEESNFVFRPTVPRDRLGALLHRGEAPYDDHSEDMGLSRSGWTWDLVAADFDNSGYPQVMHATGFLAGRTDRWAQLQEAAMSNDLILRHPELWPNVEPGDDLSGHDPNTFFVRTPEGRYVNLAREAGVASTAVTRGFAVGDVTGDGRLDFVAANQWGQSVLYRNRSKAAPFLGLHLRLPTGSARAVTTPAIGAVARLHLPDGKVTEQQLYPANGHGGVAAPDLHFGLGGQKPVRPMRVDLSWRDLHGVRHERTTTLPPGWHTLVLAADGTIAEVPA